jgi:hypothetical protein
VKLSSASFSNSRRSETAILPHRDPVTRSQQRWLPTRLSSGLPVSLCKTIILQRNPSASPGFHIILGVHAPTALKVVVKPIPRFARSPER